MANKRKSSRRKAQNKTPQYLHHKLAWVLLLGAFSMMLISSLPDMISAQQIPETAAPSVTPPAITTTGPLAVTAVVFIVAASAGVTWHHYRAQNNSKKTISARNINKRASRSKTKSH